MAASDKVIVPENSFSNNMLTFEALFLLGASALLLLGNETRLVKNLATVFSGIVLEAIATGIVSSGVSGSIKTRWAPSHKPSCRGSRLPPNRPTCMGARACIREPCKISKERTPPYFLKKYPKKTVDSKPIRI